MSTTHYVDINVVPDEESSGGFLLGALYGKLHLALVQQRRDDIGVSFPRYTLLPRSLGHCLRLHGSALALQQLLEGNWLGGVRDHVRLSAIGEVPKPSSKQRRPSPTAQQKSQPCPLCTCAARAPGRNFACLSPWARYTPSPARVPLTATDWPEITTAPFPGFDPFWRCGKDS
jgi:hypothetical protein